MFMSSKCAQVCPYNTLRGCVVEEFGAICPLSNTAYNSSTDNVEKKEELVVADNIKMHHDICDFLKGLYERKNADYGDSFHETYLEEGMAMARIRLGDKFRRFKALTIIGEQKVIDESIRDTLIDLANYAIMTVVEIDREAKYGEEKEG